MRRRLVITAMAVGILTTVGGVGAVALHGDDGKASSEGSAGLPPATAVVTQGDLQVTSQVSGTLGFTGERTLNAAGTGVVTWLPSAGTEIGRNKKVYEIGNEPVYLLYGQRPMSRTLEQGDKGPDVAQLKQNLIALGFGDGIAADDEFTPGTAAAVNAWQESHGLKETGKVTPQNVTFAPGALRVAGAKTSTGAMLQPGTPVLQTSGARKVVTFEVKVEVATRVEAGDTVTVDLPDRTAVKGRVATIGKTASKTDEDQAAKVSITVEFDKDAKANGIDEAPVTVHLGGEKRENVLSVPVEALIALSSGGFGVQTVENGRVRELPVRLGLFADGRVQVDGKGLRAGMKVGVPKK
ncbi:peptidoglycan-binding protein [Streptomyces sp. PSRA5]|uniref:peptidoglycan-binding protein n=1 Tax=Streptomyces panacea TaxID=3035064 RepID=UPI00339CF367